jgi:hypothetical protein
VDPLTGARGEIPALRHHRLIYHRRIGAGPGWEVPRGQPAVSLFERVAGARVEGRAPAGERVEARLTLALRDGRAGTWRAAARADDAGRWQLTLPYPNDVAFSSMVRAAEAYELASAGGSARLVVPEVAVREGRALPGPDLRDPTGAR